MDPKKLSTLDPKLRETYEKIMGTSAPQTNQSPQPVQPPANPVVNPSLPQNPPPMVTQTSPNPSMPAATPPPQTQQPKKLVNEPISGFTQNLPQTSNPNPKEELPPLPPLMQTQTVADSPLIENLKLNKNQEDFTKSPFASGNTTFVNPNPSPQELTTPNQTVNKPVLDKKKNKFLPVLITLGIIVFFAVYTFIWAKVFSLF